MKKIVLVLVVCMLLLLCACKSADTTTEPGGTTAPGATFPDGNSDFETPIDVDDGVTTPGNGQPSTTKPSSNGGKNEPIELPMIPG